MSEPIQQLAALAQGITLSDVADFIDRFGFSAATWVAFAFIVWQAARWGKPWLEQVLKAHLAMVSAMQEGMKSLVDSFEKLATAAEQSSKERHQIHDATQRIEERLEKLKPNGRPETPT